jgi:tRNA(Ile)-lysidine synthase
MNGKTLKKVADFIKENSLFTSGERVVVAVSGGADSVALLDILQSLDRLQLRLIVAHLNHLLRGRDADEDEEFVRQLAAGYALPHHSRRVDVRELARREKRSLEDAGRAARYAFLDEVANAEKASCIALAHHGDDQAETLLMRLLRGSAGSGLCAMGPRSADRYVRPLLSLSRHEIEAYLTEGKISWRHDKSNESLDFLRNRIRNELIPCLKGYNPAVSATLAKTAQALAADEAILASLTLQAFARHSATAGGVVRLHLAGIRLEERGLRMRLYRQAILESRGDLAEISFDHLDAVDGLAYSGRPNAYLTLPGRFRVSRRYGDLLFQREEEVLSGMAMEFRIDGPGSYPLPGNGTLAVDYAEPPGDAISAPPSTAFFDPSQVPFPWLVRSCRPGDRLSPFGMKGSKKVKDIFMDAKVPLPERRFIPLVFCGGTLLWVAGLRRGSEGSIGPETDKAVRMELIRSP